MKGEGTEEMKLPELVFDLLGLAEASPSPETRRKSAIFAVGKQKHELKVREEVRSQFGRVKR